MNHWKMNDEQTKEQLEKLQALWSLPVISTTPSSEEEQLEEKASEADQIDEPPA